MILEANGIAYTFVDYKKAGVAEAHLPDWIKRAGWETLLNTHRSDVEKTYR